MIVADKTTNSQDLIDIINLGPTNTSREQKPTSIRFYSFIPLLCWYCLGKERKNSNNDGYTHNFPTDISKDL